MEKAEIKSWFHSALPLEDLAIWLEPNQEQTFGPDGWGRNQIKSINKIRRVQKVVIASHLGKWLSWTPKPIIPHQTAGDSESCVLHVISPNSALGVHSTVAIDGQFQRQLSKVLNRVSKEMPW